MQVKIYQTYFQEDQLQFLDPAFVPNNNVENRYPHFHEYPLIKDLYSKMSDFDGHWGMVSWRWKEKTHLEGKLYLDWINNNPGYDVYFINPFMEVPANHPNVFHHGECCHGGMIDVYMNRLLKLLNVEMNLRTEHFPLEYFITCHYYVGNKKFWNGWMPFLEKCIQLSYNDPMMNEYMFHTTTYYRNSYKICFPFVVERLINLYLYLYREFKIAYYSYEEPCFKEYKLFNQSIGNVRIKQGGEIPAIPTFVKPLG